MPAPIPDTPRSPTRLRVLLVAHGYPPRERAGTEEHTRQVAEALAARGHSVAVLAATRAPGARQYELREERLADVRVVRIVNNSTTRRLSARERDPVVERLASRLVQEHRPDVAHVHHLQFLSSGLQLGCPVVATLHDGWAWCAAGGLGLLPDGTVCPGPDPERCAPCAAAWQPGPGRTAQGLIAGAGLLAPLVAPDRLHALYQKLPASLRVRVLRGQTTPEPPRAAAARNRALCAFYTDAAARLAPSRHIADLAERAGLGPVEVVPHGIEAPMIAHAERDGPLLFLGTIASHKGPDLVVRAWRRAFPDGKPGLALHGAIADRRLAEGHQVGPVLDRRGVATALTRCRALVLGSRWPENAPLVILEARAAGCPVVAPASGGIPELVQPGRDGLLYPPGDEDALVEALRTVIAAPPGPSRPPPTIDELVARLEQIYGRVTGRVPR